MSEEIIYDTVYDAMLNSYKVLVDKENPHDLIYDHSDEITFAHHIDQPLTQKDIDRMIKWWEIEEEYEMCHELKKISDGIKRLSKRN
jgi:hypothetical protein